MALPTHIWWLSNERFTVFVEVDALGLIVDTAPLTQKFVGQPWVNLREWSRTHFPGHHAFLLAK